MPRAQTPAAIPIPTLESSLHSLNVDELKWYAAVLPGSPPTRKADLVVFVKHALSDPDELQRLWAQLTPIQQQISAEVAHRLGGLYQADPIEAKYPGGPTPKNPRSYGYSFYASGANKQVAAPFDLFFAYSYDIGRYMPSDLAGALRAFVPPPAPAQLAGRTTPPGARTSAKTSGATVEVMLAETERAVFHDLGATLYLVQSGKAAVSPATRLPTLPALRLLRQNLLLGDSFPEEYERAEDAIRPLALIVLARAAKWAAPTPAGNKLELTRAGQSLLGAPLGPQHIREAWERWLKSDLLDELSRIRNIKGQQAKGTRLTRAAERRTALAAVLRDLPLGHWVELDDLLRYMRAERRLPTIERNNPSNLNVGSYSSYSMLEQNYSYSSVKYWDVIVGSYLRATLWEYVATLGMVEIAYTAPEQTPHDFGRLYGLEGDSISRYDGLLSLRLPNLGAYALGLSTTYARPQPLVERGAPVLRVLPNLDIVITDAAGVTPGERALLERIAAPQSQDVYRLSRELLLEAIGSGLDTAQIRQFLAAKSGQSDMLPTI